MKTRAVAAEDSQGRLIDVSRLSPARMPLIRLAEDRGEIRCSACGGEINICIDDNGPYCEHVVGPIQIGHEPEDRERVEAKLELVEIVSRLFPAAVVDKNVYLDNINRFADIVVVKSNGGVLAIEYRSNDMLRSELYAVLEKYKSAAVQPLILLDSRRLDLKKIRFGIGRGNINRFEVDMLREGLPLIYYAREANKFLRVQIPQELNPLVAVKSQSLGRIPIAIRLYNTDQLRVKRGQWELNSAYDPPLPPPPQLTKRLRDKLKKIPSD